MAPTKYYDILDQAAIPLACIENFAASLNREEQYAIANEL